MSPVNHREKGRPQHRLRSSFHAENRAEKKGFSLLLADLKFSTEEDYRRYTGGSLSHTMEVLALAGEMGVPVWLRHVVVPGLTDGPEHAARFAALAHTLPTLQKVELLPFHKLCLHKYENLGLPFPLADVPAASAEHLTHLRTALGTLAD